MLLDLLKMHLNLLFQAFFLLALTPKLLLRRREHYHLLILREVLFGHDILEELACLADDLVASGGMGGGGSLPHVADCW